MLSKKHFEMVAEAVAAARAEHSGSDAVEAAIDTVVDELSERFAADNPKFDRTRFAAACEPAHIDPAGAQEEAARHGRDPHALIMVLNDGETFSGLDGCFIAEVPDIEIDQIEELLNDEKVRKVTTF